VTAGAAVLVEGASDKAAIEALARRRRIDLAAAGITVDVMGGFGGVARLLAAHEELEVVALCDAGEADFVRRAFRGAGRDDARVFVCVDDLEDELIRALGAGAVEQVVAGQGELRALRTMQQQPAQRDRPVEAQLRRFLGTKSGRKEAYGRALVDALDDGAVPAPLLGVLAAALSR
jgi:hypothetical protein